MALVITACNSWLKVEPDDRIVSENLYKDKAGYMTALNGVYEELNELTEFRIRTLDRMAQYYGSAAFDYNYYNGSSSSDYENTCKLRTNWDKSYSLIAGCNEIIRQCDGESGIVLNGGYYEMIKGEALALRALLHFDLLRLYGPVWSEKDAESIPYMTRADRKTQPLLTGSAAADSVIADLRAAADLLEKVDPVIGEGKRDFSDGLGKNDWNYRQYRLNYFAVQVLLARAYLWTGNTSQAGIVARDVINRASAFFPFVTSQYMLTTPDRMFSPEVLFSLYNLSRTSLIYNKHFAFSVWNVLTAYGPNSTGRISYMYDNLNDYRQKMWIDAPNYEHSSTVSHLIKYQDETTNGAEAYRYMIPLIRMSEAYLIAAECETDVQKAIDSYINPLRFARNSPNLSATTRTELMNHIKAEYTREFVGEGQLFFYFKRLELATVPKADAANSTMNMPAGGYVVPLPDNEQQIRGL